MRIIVFGALDWGSPIQGNYHKETRHHRVKLEYPVTTVELGGFSELWVLLWGLL